MASRLWPIITERSSERVSVSRLTDSSLLRTTSGEQSDHRGEHREKPMSEFRIEKDSMGDVKVPAQAYYGAQTQRAVENFPISGQPLPPRLIRALGLVKAVAAVANRDLSKIKAEI